LVDTQDSGSCASNGVMVRLHSGAPLYGFVGILLIFFL
jgi:hypothetical protein